MTAAEIRARLEELGVTLPDAPLPAGAYVPFVREGNLVWVSGQVPFVEKAMAYAGKIDGELSLEDGQLAARLCALNAVAVLASALGETSRVTRIVRVAGYVSSSPGFTKQPLVINGASEFLAEVFGEAGRHARAAVGVAELPLNASVELELLAAVEG